MTAAGLRAGGRDRLGRPGERPGQPGLLPLGHDEVEQLVPGLLHPKAGDHRLGVAPFQAAPNPRRPPPWSALRSRVSAAVGPW